MLHHAYQTGSFQYVGRQGVLSEFTWTKTGWPEFLTNHSTPTAAVPVPSVVADEFASAALGTSWEWPVEDKPQFALSGGKLQLTARPDKGGAALGRPTLAANYTATTTLLNPSALPAGTTAGLGALGDPNNSLSVVASAGKLQVQELRDGKTRTLAEAPLPAASPAVHLRVQDQGGSHYRFAYSPDGRTWTELLPAGQTADGGFLPPWDRGVRIGVVALGPASATATFERFELTNEK
jgi:xylan 1,4-beta-xylosidase